MKNQFVFLWIAVILMLASCNNKYDKIAGYWDACFSDSVNFPRQVLCFEKKRGDLNLVIDEPSACMFGMPGERPFFKSDSLYYESLWGLYKYSGKFSSDDSIIHGTRIFNNSYSVSFVMKRVSDKDLFYKIPRADGTGKRIVSYKYSAPVLRDDGINCSALSDAGIDSAYIYKLIRDVLIGKMSTIHSLLLAKDNNLVLEEYFHTYNIDVPHELQSVTKSFTSSLMGIAIDKKFVKNVDEPVWHYFVKWDSAQLVKKKYDVRIKHLLTMTAGLKWKGLTPVETNDDIEIYKEPDFIRYILNKDLESNPGDKFYYNNRLMYLQGHIIESASGMSIDSFARKYLFNPLGIKNYSWKVFDNGITETGGGLRMLPRDMLKFGLMYLNKGIWNNVQVVSPEWVKESSVNQIRQGNQQYGYNWWIKSYSVNQNVFRTFYALGHGEQTILIIPDVNVVFVMTAGNTFQARQRLDEIILEYILPSLKESLAKSSSMTNMHLEDFAGDYETDGKEIIKIEISENSLIASDPSGQKLRLLSKGPDYFIIENSPREIKIIRNEQERISAAEVYVNGQRVEILRKIK